MRNSNETPVTVVPSAVLLPACPSLSVVAATVAPAALPLAAAPAPLWAVAKPDGIAKRRGVDRDVPGATAGAERVIGGYRTTSKQQDQLHLMSRRDPRTWRPPV
ncbi:hypothetical protein KGA66_08370 [Actinocrinis puniceicyclus]|uniref:Secreted protein n=1 Tax=Actinocrinis puniceicyclus TaxID=977794 RepID=A0A8J8BC16_9ACTN|nr:hypothetical protein [Actinocrinis puniceicyclus]MBS2963055.1 hypothetical protein [Actinocrinis puniceicyclus]